MVLTLKNGFNKTLKSKDLNVDMCEEFRVYLNSLVNVGRYSSNMMLKEWFAKAKISKKITFHGLRHTFAMMAISRGGRHLCT